MIHSVTARITSRHNSLVAEFRSVASGEDSSRILLDGVHVVAEALPGDLLLHAIVASDAIERDEVARLLAGLERSGVPVATASPAVMAAVSPVRSPSAVVALARRPHSSLRPLTHPQLIVVACDIQDPGNLGAIVRVAEAAGATGCMVVGASADPFGWKALRGSMGSALRLPIEIRKEPEDALTGIRRLGCRIVAAVPRGGVAPSRSAMAGDVAILIGGEGSGLAPALLDAADERISVPMSHPVESLNAAVTTALLLYEARRQRDAADVTPRVAPHVIR